MRLGRPCEPPGGAAVLAAPLPPPLRGGATAERLTLKKPAKSSAKQATKVAGRLEKEAALEFLSVVRVKGDGKCLFRSLVLGLAAAKGAVLSASAEEREADELKEAVAETMCRDASRHNDFPEAVFAIKEEFGSFKTYCSRLQAPTFWGGSAEVLVLSQLLRRPVAIYLQKANELGYRRLITFGERFETTKSGAARKPVKLLYSHGNHYDLLLDS